MQTNESNKKSNKKSKNTSQNTNKKWNKFNIIFILCVKFSWKDKKL